MVEWDSEDDIMVRVIKGVRRGQWWGLRWGLGGGLLRHVPPWDKMVESNSEDDIMVCVI